MTLQDNRLARTELWYAGLSCPKSNRMKSVGGCWYMLLATVIHYFAASRAAGRRGPCRAKAIPWTVGFPKPHSFRQKNGWPPAWADRRRWRGAPRTSPRVREPTLPPQFFPIPDSVSGRARQRESELPRQHAHLSAMMHVMRDHVGKHGGARRPWLRPTVPAKVLDPAPRTG